MLGNLWVNGFMVYQKLSYSTQSIFTLFRYLFSNSSNSLSVTCVFMHFSGSCFTVCEGVCFTIFGVNKSGTEPHGFQRSPICKSFQKIENFYETWEMFGKINVSELLLCFHFPELFNKSS